MPVQILATDMDGTFLRRDNTYDTQWFTTLYNRFTAAGGRFVAASGKQYMNLRRYFPAKMHEMPFIAENGALVMLAGKKLYECPLPTNSVSDIAHLVAEYKSINMLLCGENCAYVLHGHAEYRNAMSHHYNNLTEIALADIANLPGSIFKFSLLMQPETVSQNYQSLKKELGGSFALMNSGFGYLDILNKHANKGVALQHLCQLWNIPYENRMAFGDAGNDAKMLESVHYSFAMGNALPEVKQLARYIAPTCKEDGVLQVMQAMLDDGNW